MTGDAEMVKMILNHKSAEEDMLLSQSSLGKHTGNGSEQGTPLGGGTTTKAPSSGDGLALDPSSANANASDGRGEGEGLSITHELGFGVGEDETADEDGLSFFMRELPIRNPDECFGDDATEDTTGLCLWASAVVLARWVASPELQKRLEGKKVLELGAGCGAG